MIDYNFWLLFLSAAIALNVAPGPDVVYILTKTIAGGRKVGIASSLGVCTGAIFHVVISAIGLSAILVSSAIAFTVVKFIGAAYLLYLAYQAFKSSGITLDKTTPKQSQETPWKAFKQGILIDILNPKVAIFFMAFLPQFLRDGHGAPSLQLFTLGMIVIFIAFIIESSYVLLASSIAGKLREDTKYSIWLDRVVGVVFVGLGVKLATSASA